MSEFDEIMKDLGSDIRLMAGEVEKKTTKTVNISKLRMERIKIRRRISENYRCLGEVVYGGVKNNEDVSDVTKVIYEQLDDDFARIEEIYSEIEELKLGDAKYDKPSCAEDDDDEPEDVSDDEADLGDKIEDAAEDTAKTVVDTVENLKTEAQDVFAPKAE